MTALSPAEPESSGQSRARLTFVLVHGAFQIGSTWDAVAVHLRDLGHEVHTPTLAGHGPDARLDLTHADAVDSLVAYLREHDLSEVVLVAHSIAGSFVAKAAEQVPELIRRLVFQNAFVVADGNPLMHEFPIEMAALFGELDPARGFILPFEVWRELAANDIDRPTAEALYAQMWPIPVAFLADPLDLGGFYDLIGSGKLRASYVNATNDTALPPGEQGWFPRFARRLGPLCRILQLPGGHEVKNTRPAELAEVLVQAGRD
jgi:pimeloyl-ACP methyl ester carboxylesterase